MASLTRFSVSTPSRHPAKLKGYDAAKHEYFPEYVNPATWTLVLTAFPGFLLQDLLPRKVPDEIKTLQWRISQVNGSFLEKVEIPVLRGFIFAPTRKKIVAVPAPGKYEISLVAHLTDDRIDENSRIFTLRDFLIIGIGDSFASGQGNPDVPAVPAPDQKAFCEFTTIATIVSTQKARLERFFKELANKGEAALKEGLELLPVIGIVVVASLNNVENILGHVKNTISDIKGWTVEVGRKVEALLVEGTEEVFSWIGIGDGGEVDETKPRGAAWQEPLAYRSYRSGQSLAAAEVESNSLNHADRVTFLSFARTGSEILEGLLGPRKVSADFLGLDAGLGRVSIDKWTQDRGQIQEAKDALGGRRPDAIIVSIGVNDLNFSTHVEESIIRRSGERRKKRIEAAKAKISMEFPANLDRLRNEIDTVLNPRKVFITEYPVGIFKEVGEHGACGILKSFCGEDFNVSKPEARNMGELGLLLNDVIKTKAAEFGWILVDGIARDFDGHGYCSKKSYFVFAEDSCRNQGDFEGVFHPNEIGHEITRDRLAQALKRELISRRGRWLEPILHAMMV